MVSAPSAKMPMNRCENRRVPPEPPRRIVDAHVVDAKDTPHVEVVQAQAGVGGKCGTAVPRVVDAIAPGDANDGDRIGRVRMVGAGAMDQEAFAFQPFDDAGAVHDAAGRRDGWHRWSRRLPIW